MVRHKRWHYAFLLIMVVWAVSACDQTTATPDLAIVAFDRDPGAELIGYFTADAWGLYDEHLINAEYTISTDGPQAIQAVDAGQADFGIASSLDITTARAQGIDIVAVASIYRYNPMALITIGDRLIKRPRDLRGKRIAVDSLGLDTVNDRQFVSMIDHIGLNIEEMELVASAASARENLLLNDQVDAATGLSATRDVLHMRQQGYDVRTHFLADYGVLVYPQVIFTTAERIEQDADYVSRFVTATLLGYQEALFDPEGAVDALVGAVTGLDADFELSVMNMQISYIDPVDAPVGWMNLSVWERSLALLGPEMADQVLVFTCYTNEFVEAAWLDAAGE